MSDRTDQTSDDVVTGVDVVDKSLVLRRADGSTETVPLSNYELDMHAKWFRQGAFDGASGSFDFNEDQTILDPHEVIVVDNSSEWNDVWGFPSPMVTETGLYYVSMYALHPFVPAQEGDWVHHLVGADFMDEAGNNDGTGSHRLDFGKTYYPGAQPLHLTVWYTTLLPAGTHFDPGCSITGLNDGDPLSAEDLMYQFEIKRVG